MAARAAGGDEADGSGRVAPGDRTASGAQLDDAGDSEFEEGSEAASVPSMPPAVPRIVASAPEPSEPDEDDARLDDLLVQVPSPRLPKAETGEEELLHRDSETVDKLSSVAMLAAAHEPASSSPSSRAAPPLVDAAEEAVAASPARSPNGTAATSSGAGVDAGAVLEAVGGISRQHSSRGDATSSHPEEVTAAEDQAASAVGTGEDATHLDISMSTMLPLPLNASSGPADVAKPPAPPEEPPPQLPKTPRPAEAADVADCDDVLTCFQRLLERSEGLAYGPTPTEANSLRAVAAACAAEGQPAGDAAQMRAEVVRHAEGTRPIVHPGLFRLSSRFLAYKKKHGSKVERDLYNNIDLEAFVIRLLTKRPLMFMTADDEYLLRDGKTRGKAGFELIGTDKEQPPLVLVDYLSYDEMELSSLVGLSVPTHFINSGGRRNAGQADVIGSFEPKGVYIGQVGARFERPCLMEYKYMIVTKQQNTAQNGYGTAGAVRNPRLADWASFYGLDYFPTFEDAVDDVRRGGKRFVRLGGLELFLDLAAYRARCEIIAEMFLAEADARAAAANAVAFCHVVGLGLGEWQVDSRQTQIQVDAYATVATRMDLNNIGEIHFSWFGNCSSCGSTSDGGLLETKDGASIRIVFDQRNPADRLPAREAGSPPWLLVAQYAWDGNSHPGNEYWDGHLTASGDPAAACCSFIPELQNPDVNCEAFSWERIHCRPSPSSSSRAEIPQVASCIPCGDVGSGPGSSSSAAAGAQSPRRRDVPQTEERGGAVSSTAKAGVPSSLQSPVAETKAFGGRDATNELALGNFGGANPLSPNSNRLAEAFQLVGFGEGSIFNKLLSLYCYRVVRCPCCMILLYFLLLVAIVCIWRRPFEIDTDFTAFIKADGPSMRRREAYLLALDAKKGLNDRRLSDTTAEVEPPAPFSASVDMLDLNRQFGLTGEERSDSDGWTIEVSEDDDSGTDPFGRRLKSLLFMSRELTILYAPVGTPEKGALDERVLRDMRDLELRLRSLPGWKALCNNRVRSVSRWGCDPGESLAAYAWPSQVNSSGSGRAFTLEFDARGSELLPLPALLAYLEGSSRKEHDLRRYFPKDYVVPDVFENIDWASPPVAIRTKYTFKIQLATSATPFSQVRAIMEEVKQMYADVIIDEVYPLLVDAQEEYPNTRVFYSGDVITGHEVNTTLMKDILYALGSILFVFCYMWWHTRSVLLSSASLLIIFTSVPVAYVLTPASKTTIASFLSLFLITGVGSDVVFVFTDFWEQSAQLKQLELRTKWMITHAGKACLATSVTTSVSFFANLASALQPLREFGLFMGLCVMCAFLHVLLFVPPLLVFQQQRRAKRKQRAPVERVKIRTVDISRGQTDTLALAPSKQGICCVSDKKGSQDFAPGREFLFNAVGWISNCPIVIVTLVASFVLACIIGVAVDAKMDQGLPAIFPEDHNQVLGMEIHGKFASLTDTDKIRTKPVSSAALCNPGGSHEECIMRWCEAALDTEYGVDSVSGSCFSGPATNEDETPLDPGMGLQDCGSVAVKGRLVTSGTPPAWSEAMKEMAAEASNRSSLMRNFYQMSYIPFGLAMENWETGQVNMKKIYNTGVMEFGFEDEEAVAAARVPKCRVTTVCFMGTPKCTMPGFRELGTYNVSSRRLVQSSSSARSGAPMSLRLGLRPASPERIPSEAYLPPLFARDLRRLQGGQVPQNKQVDVTVLWGVEPAHSTPLVGPPEEQWRFDSSFQPDNPWAQRAIMRMCDELPEELMVTKSTCWIRKFKTRKTAAVTGGKRFPSRNFDADVALWWSETIEAATNIWISDGKVKACKLAFYVNLAIDAPSAKVLDYQVHWDKYIDQMNRRASVTANRAWHTAQVWVRAEAEIAIIASTQETIVISAACAFTGMLCFTGNPTLAFLVLMLVLGIICGLAFFMVNVMGWAIGPVEVISLVVFVGYSVTYALHIAHNYAEVEEDNPRMLANEEKAKEKRRRAKRLGGNRMSDDEDERDPEDPDGNDEDSRQLTATELRTARARMAIVQLGGATASSAMSTLGSSVFLLFCTLNIFKKLGTVVIAVTALSILFALIALPAALMLFGPEFNPWYFRKTKDMVIRLWVSALGLYHVHALGEEPLVVEDEERDDQDGHDRENLHQPLVAGRPV